MNKIDFVVPWVDGSDPDWIQEKMQYTERAKKSSTDQVGDLRYRDWGLLKYWFRGVEKYAPWANKIHFITYGHLPEWLNTNHPKLNIVNHCDFIDEKYLPTFNVCTIELNMHKIKGLSDKFVYFNDDCFIINHVDKEDFFQGGLPCDEGVFGNVFVTNSRASFGYPLLHMTGIINEHFNFSDVVKKHRDKFINPVYEQQIYHNEYFMTRSLFPGLYSHHLPQSYNKSIFSEVWEKNYEHLDKISMEKFRIDRGAHQYLMRYWQVMTGQFHPTLHRKLGMSFNRTHEEVEQIINFIINQERPIACINDTVEVNIDEVSVRFQAAFDTILGEKSSFEK